MNRKLIRTTLAEVKGRGDTPQHREGGGGGGGGGMARERVETTTNCSSCGKETTVPFRPTQGRPVFCRECFQQRKFAGV